MALLPINTLSLSVQRLQELCFCQQTAVDEQAAFRVSFVDPLIGVLLPYNFLKVLAAMQTHCGQWKVPKDLFFQRGKAAPKIKDRPREGKRVKL